MKFSDWIRENNNKKIIITNSVANANKLCRKYNKESGEIVKNVNPFTLCMIATEFLQAYCAINEEYVMGTMIDSESATYILDKILRNNKLSFVPQESLCIKTTEEIFSSINQIRANKLKPSALSESKILELNNLIELYNNELEAQGFFDNIKLLQKVNEIFVNATKEDLLFYLPWIKDCYFGILNDYEMTVCERTFMDNIEAVAGTTSTILEFTNEEPNDAVQYEFFKAYGMNNEVEFVVDSIEKEGLAYGDVNVLYTSGQYEDFIKCAFESKKIPYKFVSGSNIGKNDVVQFLVDILNWAKEDFLYESLAVVADNPQVTLKGIAPEDEKVRSVSYYYDKYLRKKIGWGRERYYINGENEDEYVFYNEFLKDLANTFESISDIGVLYEKLIGLCSKYIVKNKNNKKIIAILKDKISFFHLIGQVEEALAIQYIQEHLLNLSISEDVSTCAVSVIKIGQVEVLDRENNFIIGLSSKQFSADVKESPVLSDNELEKYLEGRIELSRDNPIRMRKKINTSLDSLSKGRIIMGYSRYDIVNMKENFPAAFYLECKELHNSCVEANCSYNYIVTPISIDSKSLLDRIVDEEAAEEAVEEIVEEPVATINISASGLQTLIECVLKYYYSYVEHMTQREFLKKSDSSWLDPVTKGNLFHYFMEDYCNTVLGQNEITETIPDNDTFNEIYDGVIKRIQEEMPYASQTIFEKERDDAKELVWNFLCEFYKQMSEDYQNNIRWRIIGNEIKFKDIDYTFKAVIENENNVDVTFNGGIDRLDGYVNSEGVLCLRIIDYKTGNKGNKDKEIKANKQIQHFIYAIAALKYVEDNKAVLEELFGVQIQTTVIEDMIYVFPYEKPEEQELSTKSVLEANMQNSEYKLPSVVDNIAWTTLSKIITNNSDIKSQLELLIADNVADIKKKDTHCKYCEYKKQCRVWTGSEL